MHRHEDEHWFGNFPELQESHKGTQAMMNVGTSTRARLPRITAAPAIAPTAAAVTP